MADNNQMNELLLSETAVPDIFIVSHMASLSKDAICLYIWILMTSSSGKITDSEIRGFFLLNEQDTGNAATELIEHGLLIKSEKSYQVTDIRKAEVDAYCRAQIAKGNMDTAQGLSGDEAERNQLAGSINRTFFQGRMPFSCYRLIDTCLYEYKFQGAVVYRLFEEGRNRKQHFYESEMAALARSWYNKGYTTLESLREFIENSKQVDEAEKLVRRLLRRSLNSLDHDYCTKWVEEYHASMDLVEYAFKTNAYRDSIKIMHIDQKLAEWYAAGITAVDAAAVYENERYQENKERNKLARKRKKNSVSWKTGSEAGIDIKKTEASAESLSDVSDMKETDDGGDDPILNMFRGVDD